MSSANGHKPRPDAGLLTPNDLRRLRVALGGRDPAEVLGGDATEDTMQGLILAYKLRENPEFTWEQAGDVPPGELFDLSADEDAEPDPPTAPAGSPGPAAATNAVSGSKPKRPKPARGPSSATSTG